MQREPATGSLIMTFVLSAIDTALKAAGLDAILRQHKPQAWQTLWQTLAHQSTAYADSMLDYQNAYFSQIDRTLEDISLVLFNDGHACAIWPLTLSTCAGSVRIPGTDKTVMAPLFASGLSTRSRKKICAHAIHFLRILGAEHGLTQLLLEQHPQPGLDIGGATDWHQQLLVAGATVVTRHDLYVDLRPPLADIRATYRKSYRPLVNLGLRTWSAFELNHTNAQPSVWAEFRQLHLDAAGRNTRSDETWAAQYQMIVNAEAFLIGLRDPVGGHLTGAGFFQFTRDEGIYSVAAYNRSLFDKPLGHAVQQRAIETLKRQGQTWYRLGQRFYAQDLPQPSDKEVSISVFKQGFASHVFCDYEFQLPIQYSSDVCLTLS